MSSRNTKNFPADKLPPQNTEAEQAVLGSLLLDREAIIKVADTLQPKDFYQRNNRLIYEAILYLYERSEPADLINVSNRLKSLELLEEVGGMSYLTSLVNMISTPAHVASHAKIDHPQRVLRDLISAAYDISSLGYREDEDTDILLDEAEQKIFSISQDILSKNFIAIKGALEEAFERIERLHQGQGDLRGIPTGYPKLDNILAGFQRSDLIILAARPSLGKTSLALDIARQVATKHKLPVGILSLEMSKEQLVDRICACYSSANIITKFLNGANIADLAHKIVKIRDAL